MKELSSQQKWNRKQGASFHQAQTKWFWNYRSRDELRRPAANPLAGTMRCERAERVRSSFYSQANISEDQIMGFFSKDIENMDDLFVHTLRDIYYAEQKIVRSLPTMIEKAMDLQLKEGFERHLAETRNHVRRLERVFDMHSVERSTVNCPAIDGIIKEADEVAGEVDDRQVLDAALIAAAQAVEHYEIARYGALISWARQLGRDDCVAVLHETLEEEKAADKALTDIAESQVNAAAEMSR